MKCVAIFLAGFLAISTGQFCSDPASITNSVINDPNYIGLYEKCCQGGSERCECLAGQTCCLNSGSDLLCVDADECMDGTDDCDVNAACTNLPNGNGWDCTCNAGYTGDGRSCTDIDECALGLDDCSTFGICTNLPDGGFWSCACQAGYTGDGVNCVDLNECASPGDNNCDDDATCTNLPDGGGFACTCNSGFQGDGTVCTDINECALPSLNDCSVYATCTNVPNGGGWTCACNSGFTGDGVTCADIDECVDGGNDCDANAICTNLPLGGGWSCACATGFEGTGQVCTDTNECSSPSLNDCSADATCTNVPAGGGFTCACNPGFTGNGQSCADINECDPDPCQNGATCSNLLNAYSCTCPPEFYGTNCENRNGGFTAWSPSGAPFAKEDTASFGAAGSCTYNVQTETRTCTDPAPVGGGEDCEGALTRLVTVNRVGCTCNLCEKFELDGCSCDSQCKSNKRQDCCENSPCKNQQP